MGHYILKGVTDALFLVFRNYHNRLPDKNNADVIATGCVIALRSVQGVLVPPSTLYGVTIYSNVGVSLSVFRLGCGRPRRRMGRCKHPRFLFVVSHMFYPVRSGC